MYRQAIALLFVVIFFYVGIAEGLARSEIIASEFGQASFTHKETPRLERRSAPELQRWVREN